MTLKSLPADTDSTIGNPSEGSAVILRCRAVHLFVQLGGVSAQLTDQVQGPLVSSLPGQVVLQSRMPELVHSSDGS